MEFNRLLAEGVAIGLSDMGGKVVKYDDTHIFVLVKKGSELDDEGALSRLKEAFLKMGKRGLKIKKVDKL